MKKNKNGFTLIELLAVIVILGIIMLIAVPSVTNIIMKVKKDSFFRSAELIVDSAVNEVNGNVNYSDSESIFDLSDAKSGLTYSGKKYKGIVSVDDESNTKINLWDQENKWCIYKGYGDSEYKIKYDLGSYENCLSEVGSVAVKTLTSLPTGGTFIQPWLYTNWTNEQWTKEIAEWKSIGIQYLIMGDVAVKNTTTGKWKMFYNSSLSISEGMYYEALDVLFQKLQGTGIKLFLGMGYDPALGYIYTGNESDRLVFYNYSIDSAMIAEELYNKYKASYPDIFYGFYFVPELYNSNSFEDSAKRTTVVNNLASGLNVIFSKLNQLNPSMPMLFSPYVNIFGGGWVTKNPDYLQAFYTELFNTANFRNGDIIAPQDGLGAGGMDLSNLSTWTKAYKQATENSSKDIVFWANVETFDQPDDKYLYPTDSVDYWATGSLNRIVSQIDIELKYTNVLLWFSYPHYISSVNSISGISTALKNYYNKGIVDTIAPVAATTAVISTTQVNSKEVLKVTLNGAKDDNGILRLNVYKDSSLFTFRVSTRNEGSKTVIAQEPNNFYDADFNLTTGDSTYEFEFVDVFGNKSDKVRVTVKASDIGKTINLSNLSSKTYKSYSEGDLVTLKDGSKWHVITTSDATNSTVKLLKDTSIGIMPFDMINYRDSSTSSYCGAASYGGCNAFKAVLGTYSNGSNSGSVFENSYLYDYLNFQYKPTLLNNSISGVVGDIELITKDEYLSLKSKDYSWLNVGGYWWTMTPYGTNVVDMYVIPPTGDVYNYLVTDSVNFNVRPVITILKDNIN